MPVLGGVDSVASFFTVNEQSELDVDCNFHSSVAYFASGRSYHKNVLLELDTSVVKSKYSAGVDLFPLSQSCT